MCSRERNPRKFTARRTARPSGRQLAGKLFGDFGPTSGEIQFSAHVDETYTVGSNAIDMRSRNPGRPRDHPISVPLLSAVKRRMLGLAVMAIAQ